MDSMKFKTLLPKTEGAHIIMTRDVASTAKSASLYTMRTQNCPGSYNTIARKREKDQKVIKVN